MKTVVVAVLAAAVAAIGATAVTSWRLGNRLDVVEIEMREQRAKDTKAVADLDRRVSKEIGADFGSVVRELSGVDRGHWWCDDKAHLCDRSKEACERWPIHGICWRQRVAFCSSGRFVTETVGGQVIKTNCFGSLDTCPPSSDKCIGVE